MGVYIKGMEMPEHYTKMDFGYDADGNPQVIVGEEVYDVIPVPPHGRLVDANELRCLYDPHDYGLDGEQADEYDRYHVSLPVIRQNIDDMPTIIPAEERMDNDDN